MQQFKMVEDYKHDAKLRNSFTELSKMIFGIDFDYYYDSGYWNDNYTCYSMVDGDKVVANVSINFMDLIVDGQEKKALQLSTVMTNPDYRMHGLAAQLMNHVIGLYEHKVDFMYLGANETVLNFYPRFGFEKYTEYQYTLRIQPEQAVKPLRKLSMEDPEDRCIVERLTQSRVPHSSRLATFNDQHLLRFYCIGPFAEILYYWEEEDIMIVYTSKEGVVNLYDVISQRPFELRKVIGRIADPSVEKVIFHFTPDIEDEDLICEPTDEGHRFIRYQGLSLPEEVYFPAMAQG